MTHLANYAPALPHGPIREVFPNVFLVEGLFRMAPGFTITRNMAILRQGSELTLVNSVRLTESGLRELDSLGKVKHLFKLGAFHGIDDPFYVHRYHPTFWAPPGSRHEGDLHHTAELVPQARPRPDLRVFAFEHGKQPEVALLLEQDGGILLTCDSYQNWESFDGCSLFAKVVMRGMGFGPKVVGGPWTKAMGQDVRQDLERLCSEPFAHLVPAHGAVLRDTAQDGLREAIRKRFGGGTKPVA
ncbi:MAG: hypothetical protein HY902_02025 [Deltaproteobacteria bacterium]|nr:hypothetical protein [Deltaproteobacteria bacterium]